MEIVEYAYHVTDQSADDEWELEEPDWDELVRNNTSMDEYHNGFMSEIAGEGVVFLTTTLLDHQLPTTTVYPVDDEPGEYWRVAVPLDRFDGYRILLCKTVKSKKSVKQVSLLLTDPDDDYLNAIIEEAKDEGQIRELTDTPNHYLYQHPSMRFWKSNNYGYAPSKKYWVNIAVACDIELDDDCVWDVVEKY